MNKPYFLAYGDDLRRFYTVVSFQIENTPCVIGLYAVCTFLHPLVFAIAYMTPSAQKAVRA